MEWYRHDKAAVSEALRRGERPDLATTMASGPLDELVALHQELGIFALVDKLEVQRARAGVPDELRLAHAGDLAVCGVSVPEWGQRSALPRTGRVAATGLGPGADPARQQWAASASAGAARRIAALSSRYAARCGSRALGSQRGCTRKLQECSRSISGSWCEARSTPLMAAAWVTISVWWPWCVCRPPVRSSWPGAS